MTDDEVIDSYDDEINPRTFFEWELGAALSSILDVMFDVDEEIPDEEIHLILINAEEVFERWTIKYQEHIDELMGPDITDGE